MESWGIIYGNQYMKIGGGEFRYRMHSGFYNIPSWRWKTLGSMESLNIRMPLHTPKAMMPVSGHGNMT